MGIKQTFNVLLGIKRNSDIYFTKDVCFRDYEIAEKAEVKYFHPLHYT